MEPSAIWANNLAETECTRFDWQEELVGADRVDVVHQRGAVDDRRSLAGVAGRCRQDRPEAFERDPMGWGPQPRLPYQSLLESTILDSDKAAWAAAFSPGIDHLGGRFCCNRSSGGLDLDLGLFFVAGLDLDLGHR